MGILWQAGHANAFIARRAAAGASERANSQPFLCELCNMLGVARPEPTRETGYAFEYDVTEHHPGGFHRSRVAWLGRFRVCRCQTNTVTLTIGVHDKSVASYLQWDR